MRFFARVCSIILLMQHFSSAASTAVPNPSNSQAPNTTLLLLLIFLAIVILIGAVIYYQRNQKMTLMDALLSQSKDGIWVTDEQFRIIEINNAFSEISGYKKADVLGKKFKALTQAGRDTQLEEIIQQELSNDGYWSGEIWNLRKEFNISRGHYMWVSSGPCPLWVVCFSANEEESCGNLHIALVKRFTRW